MKVVLRKDGFLAAISERPLTSLSCKIVEQERAELLLQSLPDSYDQLIIKLINNNVINLVFDDVVAVVLQEENQRKNKEDKQVNLQQAEALTTMRGRSRERGESSSHKHGRSKSRSKKNLKCYNCGKKGHLKKDCWSLNKNSNPQGNTVNTSDDGDALCCEASTTVEGEKIAVNLYMLKEETLLEAEASVASCSSDSEMLWHQKLVQMSEQGMKVLVKQKLLLGLTKVSLPLCEHCITNVFSTFKNFKARVELDSGNKIKCFRTDNGGEYTSEEFDDFYRKEGIKRQFTVANTPQQNGEAEWMNRTLLERTRAMLRDAGLEKSFWAKAVNTACYLVNRAPSIAIELKTPMEMWTGKPADYSNLHVFGSIVYMMYNAQEISKLDPKSKKCKFLGFANGLKGYPLWDPTARKVIISRDVILVEDKLQRKEDDDIAEKSETTQIHVKKEFEQGDSSEAEQAHDEQEPESSKVPTTRQSDRVRRRPNWHSDYVIECNIAYCLLTENGEPSTYQEAINSSDASLEMVTIKLRGIVQDWWSNDMLKKKYAKVGDFKESIRLFMMMVEKGIEVNSYTFSCVLKCLAALGGLKEGECVPGGLEVFKEMLHLGVEVDSATIVSVLVGCANSGTLSLGKAVHGLTIKSCCERRINFSNTLLDMYSKCGDLDGALRVFEKMGERNVVSWTSMIAGYTRDGRSMEPSDCSKNGEGSMDDANSVFSSMAVKDIISWNTMIGELKPESRTMACILPACTSLSALERGKEIHGHILRNGYSSDQHVANALVDLYVKCGVLGIEPHEVSFISIVYARSHSGLLEEGGDSLHNENDFNIEPKLEHYACMDYHEVELAEKVAELVFKLDQENTGYYLLLANIYAEAEKWEEVKRMRETIGRKGLRKSPGCIWIEIKGKVNIFVSGNNSHPQSKKIESLLKKLRRKMDICLKPIMLDNADEMKKEMALWAQISEYAATVTKWTSSCPRKLVEKLCSEIQIDFTISRMDIVLAERPVVLTGVNETVRSVRLTKDETQTLVRRQRERTQEKELRECDGSEGKRIGEVGRAVGEVEGNEAAEGLGVVANGGVVKGRGWFSGGSDGEAEEEEEEWC
ncbi:Rho termination factor, putative isoform 1 [Hibiscus syriacus]|uniref:Rho termination factor, putative isoform 1 n=1 Tax=Hibiscus syriacus TaxID=106335 RepID=A0A6A2YCW8_HIBSY|nr:Rho termination factor, putative isoform 1 [Hibiscus syriacus]